MEKTRTIRKITEWNPYTTRPRLRWMDQVEEDLQIMKIIGSRMGVEDRREWSRIVEQTKLTQGSRVNRRRRRFHMPKSSPKLTDPAEI